MHLDPPQIFHEVEKTGETKLISYAPKTGGWTKSAFHRVNITEQGEERNMGWTEEK